MNFVLNNLQTIYIPLLIFALVLIYFLRINHLKLNKVSNQKLAVVYNAIEEEKLLAKKYRNTDNIVKSLEHKTQSKLLKIKIDVITIDFTIREIIA